MGKDRNADLVGKDWFTTYTVFARPQGEPGWLGLEGRDVRIRVRRSTGDEQEIRIPIRTAGMAEGRD